MKEHCNKDLPSNLSELVKKFSEEQENSFYAMRELLCFHDDPYGKGETFCLETPETECKTITVTSIIGRGGSKKAALIDDKSVIMFPNTDVHSLASTARWWPETVTKEAAMARFLEEIEVPGLNRKKAHLVIPSKNNPEISYKLPVLISDSFEQYASKGWFVIDKKNPLSTAYSDKALENWKLELRAWEETIKPLIRDLSKLSLNSVPYTGDAGNLVLVEKDGSPAELHYFGFDFGGKYGSSNVPSEVIRSETRGPAVICNKISEKLEDIIAGFVFNQLSEKQANQLSNEEINNFSNMAGKYFSSCDFITKVLGDSSHGDSSEL